MSLGVVGACGRRWCALVRIGARCTSLVRIGAYWRALHVVGARCARLPGCAVRASLVRVGARCVGFAMRAPSQRCQRCRQGCQRRQPSNVSALRVVGAPCALVRVAAVRVACRCASFLLVVASLWLTVRRFMVYGAVVVSVSLHGTSNPGNPHRTRWRRFTRARLAVAPSHWSRWFRCRCVALGSF